jgi:hypothetical protein
MGRLVISRTRESLAVLSVFTLLVLPTGCPLDQPANATGAVHVNATLDDSPWAGPVDFTVTCLAAGTAVPATFAEVPVGDYALDYLSGGPSYASFVGSTPPGPQTLTTGGAVTFTLDFRTIEMARSDIVVMAILKQAEGDVSWMGELNFILTGPEAIVGAYVPGLYNGMPVSEYTLEYVSGGPPNTSFIGITPPSPQFLSAGDTLIFKMEFE